jgi:hypothetical protein
VGVDEAIEFDLILSKIDQQPNFQFCYLLLFQPRTGHNVIAKDSAWKTGFAQSFEPKKGEIKGPSVICLIYCSASNPFVPSDECLTAYFSHFLFRCAWVEIYYALSRAFEFRVLDFVSLFECLLAGYDLCTLYIASTKGGHP